MAACMFTYLRSLLSDDNVPVIWLHKLVSDQRNACRYTIDRLPDPPWTSLAYTSVSDVRSMSVSVSVSVLYLS